MLMLPLWLAAPVSVQAVGPLLLADVSAAQAGSLAAKRTGGKVLKVSEEERNGRRVYRVKVLLPEGRVKTLFIDSKTGGSGG
jgi:hypothetical protein